MARHATDTKTRILEITRTLFSSHGCENTTIDDIITALGITKGAFYHYFKSKEALCEAVLDEVISDYRKLVESIDEDIEPIDRLRVIIQKLAELNASGQWVNCRLLLRLSIDSHESYQGMKRKIQGFWRWYEGFYEDLVSQCQQKGQLGSRLDEQTQAQLLMSVMAGAIMLENNNPDSEAFAKLTDAIIGIMRR